MRSVRFPMMALSLGIASLLSEWAQASNRTEFDPAHATSEDSKSVVIRYGGTAMPLYSGSGEVRANSIAWISFSRKGGYLWRISRKQTGKTFRSVNGQAIAFALTLSELSSRAEPDQRAVVYRPEKHPDDATLESRDGFMVDQEYTVDVIDLKRALKFGLGKGPDGMGETRADRIRVLWSSFIQNALEGPINAASFQLAIWMLQYDDLELSSHFDEGVPFAIKSLAEEWVRHVKEADNTADRANLVALSRVDFVDQIVEVLPPSRDEIEAGTLETSWLDGLESPRGDDFWSNLAGSSLASTVNPVDRQILSYLFEPPTDFGSISDFGWGTSPGGGSAERSIGRRPGSSGGGGFGGGGGGFGGGGGSGFLPFLGFQDPSDLISNITDPPSYPPSAGTPGYNDFPTIPDLGPSIPREFPLAGPEFSAIPIPEPSSVAVWLVISLTLGYGMWHRSMTS
jgi:uncharacterized membrane protein YgcG